MGKIGKKTGIFIFLLISFFCFFGQSQESKIQVYVTVDRNELGLQDTLNVSVHVQTEDDVSVEEPRIPNLKNFDLLNTWVSQSSQTNISHGSSGMKIQKIKTKTFNYSLAPKKTGSLKIDAFTVDIDGKSYRTKSLDIRVTSGSQVRPRNRSGRRNIDPFSQAEEMMNQFFGQSRRFPRPSPRPQIPPQINPNDKEGFLIRAEVNKKEVYVGEQLTVNWYIYTRGVIETIDRLKFPNLKNFWKEDIEVSPSLNFRPYVVNGVAYRRALLGSYALFPIRAGEAKIDSYKVKCRLRLGGGFSFGPSRSYTQESPVIQIKVKELPLEGRPVNFSGAVGNFSVVAFLANQGVGRQKNLFSVNQPLSLKIRFEGEGNAKLIDLPKISWPSGIEYYDTQVDSKFFKTGRSYKEFEVLLIPRKEGEFQIPSMEFSIFNPETQKYENRQTEPLDLNIIAGRQDEALPSQVFQDKGVEKDVGVKSALPPRITSLPEVSLSQRLQPLTKWIWWSIYGFIFIFSFFYARQQLGWGKAKTSLQEVVDQRLIHIRQYLDQEDYRAVGTEATNLIYLVLGELTGQGGASVEFEKMMEMLAPSVRKKLKEPLAELLPSFEALGFAPDSVTQNLRNRKDLESRVDRLDLVLRKVSKKTTRSVSS